MRYNTLTKILKERSKLNNIGITFIEKSNQEIFFSYEDLYRSALKSLSFLQAAGLKPKDELVFQIEDNQTLVTVFWACILGGIIPVPLAIGKNDEHKQKLFNVWKVLNNPYLIISENNCNGLYEFAKNKTLAATYAEIKRKSVYETDVLSSPNIGKVHSVKENDIAFVQFSSGSTGIPKGVALTHKNLIANIEAISKAANYSEKESMISWMPLTHDMGMIGFHINPLFKGMNQYLIPTDLFIRRPAIWLDKVSEHKVNILCAPNFGYNYVIKHCTTVAHDWDLSCVRIIFNGAEPISRKLCDAFSKELSRYGLSKHAMCPVYGLAEASLAVSISNLDDEVLSVNLDRSRLNVGDKVDLRTKNETNVSFVNVGRSIEYCSIRIAGEGEVVCADEVIGHVQIKGENVTTGYYNNPDATANAITSDGWLDTGDLGFLKDGALYITGRAKDIIFSNGQNYYVHDIERIAEKVEGIELNKIAVAGSFDGQNQKEAVIVFVFYKGDLEKFIPLANAVKAVISSKAGLEVDTIIPVKDMPRTTSGKLQRFKLLERYRNGFFTDVEGKLARLREVLDKDDLLLPGNEKEEKLLRIWEEVLESGNIGVNRKFFEIGGNSLKAAELTMKMQREFHIELTTTALYQFQTVRELVAEMDNLSRKPYEPIPTAMQADTYPVSSSQKRLYYAWKADSSSIAYNIPVAIRLRGAVNAQKLEQCLRILVLHHDALRMTFHLNEPRFTVCDNVEVRLDRLVCDSSGWNERLKDLVRPFDLAQGPLFRFFLLQQDGINESLLFLDFHHIVSDGQSVYWFIEQLLDLYSGKELLSAVSYRDFVFWQQKYYSEDREIAKQYWLDQFYDGVPVLELPADFPRPVVLNTEGKRKEFLFRKKTADELKRIAGEMAVTPHALIFTLYNILLSKYSGQEDIVIGLPVSGRRHPDLQQAQGMFVNNLAIRNILSGAATFADTVKQAASMLNEAYDHQGLAFDDLVGLLDNSSRPGRNPVFDTMFLYQHMEINDRKIAGLEVSRYSFDPGFSKFDISMEVFEEKEGIRYSFEYATTLFKDETVLRLSEGFKRMVERAIKNPGIRIADLSVLSDEEFDEFMVGFNATDNRPRMFKSVREYFDEQVKSDPNAVALICNGEEITYEELNNKASKIACSLISNSVNKGDLIGVHLSNSPQLIISLLGVLKSGAAYLPIDLGTPDERLKFILNDSQCKYIITEIKSRYTGLDIVPGLLEVQELLRDVKKVSFPAIGAGDLAYVIYTSGTSGKPKGVMIEQGSLVNYVLWAADQYVGKEACSFALYSSISFDLTVTSVFVPLLTGNQLVIYEEDHQEVSIEKVIRDNRVDVVKLTPSHLRLLCSNNLLSPKCRVKRFIVGGENLDMNLASEVHQIMNGKVEIFNEYGPTEATVGCMIYKFDPRDDVDAVPIGKPIANSQIYLLDKYLNPLPLYANGEIYISGACLARGYLFRDDLTTEKFVENPYVTGSKMYKTGDNAKRLPGGNLVFTGRNDQQVKINGYRIELSEIEKQLINSGYVDQVAVTLDPGTHYGINLYYTVPKINVEPDEIMLRNYLSARLPHYMIPARFIQIESIPLTRNGKVDTGRLQNIKTQNGRPDDTVPKNEIESILVEVWKEVLNEDAIGVNDNFFELGGDSIKAVQISSKLFEKGISIKVKDILTYNRIKHISQYAEPVNNQSRYEQSTVEGAFMATPIQSWFLSQQFKNPNYYNQSVLFAINGELNIPVLEKTFEGLIERHDALRINIDPENCSLFYNNEHLKQKFLIQEFEVKEESELEHICNEIRSSFDLSKSLLMKAAVIKAQHIAYLFITIHHLIMDGVSWRILMEDFYRAYSASINGDKISFPAKTASFKNWSSLIHQFSGSKGFEEEREYWRSMEDNNFTLPTDIEAKDWLVKDMRSVVVSLDKEKTEFLLKDAHRAYNSDVLILLNAALVRVLHKWTGLKEFVIEQENHGRYLEDLDVSGTIGWFTAMFPIKFVHKNEIGMLIRSVKEILKNVPGNGIGYGVWKYLERQPARPPISEIRFNYLGQFGRELNNELLVFKRDHTGIEISKQNHLTTKLEFNVLVVGNKLSLEIYYSDKAYKNVTVNKLAESFINSLTDILAYLENDNSVHFTPSDFEHVDLNEEEIYNLFDD